MDPRVRCPGCKKSLKVPSNSAGKTARCPACHEKFPIPAGSELIEETISTWIEQDVEGLRQESDQEYETLSKTISSAIESESEQPPLADSLKAKLGVKTSGSPPSKPTPKASEPSEPSEPSDSLANPATAETPSGSDVQAGQPKPINQESPDLPVPSTAQTKPAAAPSSSASKAEDAPVSASTHSPPITVAYSVQGEEKPQPEDKAKEKDKHRWPMKKAAPPPVGLGLVPRPASSGAAAGASTHGASGAGHEARAGESAGRRSSAEPLGSFPLDLEDHGPRPHLVVRGCELSGVRLGFDSRWLGHEGFRLSMPLRCPWTGKTDHARLLARPLVFIDRAQNTLPSVREAESGREQLVGRHSPRQLLENMGTLEGLPKPFCYPMPYYVDRDAAGSSLECATYNRPDGGITCEVLIPEGQHALEWLGRVNSICGPDYALLERAVDLLWSDAWRELSQETRGRIGGWCDFGEGEQFLRYFSDVDLPKSDYGLAGVILTDRRLVYAKFHHKGQINLSDPVLIQGVSEGESFFITLRAAEVRPKVVRLSRTDIYELARLISLRPDAKTEVVIPAVAAA